MLTELRNTLCSLNPHGSRKAGLTVRSRPLDTPPFAFDTLDRAAVAVVSVGAAIRRKGAFGGVLDTALDAMPGVGAVKNAFEAVRGRDFIKDKMVKTSSRSR